MGFMMTFALMLTAFAAGMWLRDWFTRERDVLSPEAQLLLAAMRETEVSPEYQDGVYQVYAGGRSEIRWFDGRRIRLLIDSGYTVAYVA